MGSELYHDGQLGMRWHHRRWQYPDGTLTPAGRERYRKKLKKMSEEDRKKVLLEYQPHDAKLTYMFRKELSRDELLTVINRLDTDKKLKALIDTKTKSKVDTMYEKLEKTVKWGEQISKAEKVVTDAIKNGKDLKDILENIT